MVRTSVSGFSRTVTPMRHRVWLDRLDPVHLETFDALDAAWRQPIRTYDPPKLADTELGSLVAGFGPREMRAFTLWVQLSGFVLLTERHRNCSLIHSVSVTLARRKQVWEPAELDVLWDVAITCADTEVGFYFPELLRIPVAATERLSEPDRYAELLRRSRVLCDGGWQEQMLPLKNRIDTLLVQAGLLTVAEQAASILSGDDEFTKLLNVDLSGSLDLLRHWRTATSPQPPQKWTKQALDLLGETSPDLMRTLLQHAHRHCDGLALETVTLMRGLTWSLEHVTADWVVRPSETWRSPPGRATARSPAARSSRTLPSAYSPNARRRTRSPSSPGSWRRSSASPSSTTPAGLSKRSPPAPV